MYIIRKSDRCRYDIGSLGEAIINLTDYRICRPDEIDDILKFSKFDFGAEVIASAKQNLQSWIGDDEIKIFNFTTTMGSYNDRTELISCFLYPVTGSFGSLVDPVYFIEPKITIHDPENMEDATLCALKLYHDVSLPILFSVLGFIYKRFDIGIDYSFVVTLYENVKRPITMSKIFLDEIEKQIYYKYNVRRY